MIDTDKPLDEADLDPDPIVEFERWFRLAGEVGEPQPNAMALATATPDAAPSVRMVLLHRVDERGFVFFTNYESAKGRDLAGNPRAAAAFYWQRLHRQVRLGGPVARVSREESEEYWAQRPYGSRISAAASAQSRPIASRAVLEAAVARLQVRHPESPPLPGFWGGYRITPAAIEFWQGRINRLHDRLQYVRDGDGWRVERLAP
ncbi:MAG TPA: pyridoxamine 5'-phosphate oxidase [Candidatus Eisenbacteria bacterium]|nr:pyridoxamine 5'-phosphate oxidase [Candidatus Eisenbacteria bacterium]